MSQHSQEGNGKGDFSGKVCLVVGGSTGIGGATVRILAAGGGKVIIAGRSEEKASTVIKEIIEAGGVASYVKTDVYKETDISNAVEFAVKTYGRLDCVLNVPGGVPPTPFLNMTTEAWDKAVAYNLTAPFHTMRYASRAMMKTGGGSIVCISTQAAQLPYEYGNTSVYGALKAGLDMLVKSAAAELAENKIRINCVNPGATDTEGIGPVRHVEENFENIVAATASGRWVDPHETAQAVCFLLSDKASGISGQQLIVDGGGFKGRIFFKMPTQTAAAIQSKLSQ